MSLEEDLLPHRRSSGALAFSLQQSSMRCRHRSLSLSLSLSLSPLQAVGKVPVDVNSMTVDLMSISGHKLYGPKGVGALYVRRRPRVRLEPIMSGGGQER